MVHIVCRMALLLLAVAGTMYEKQRMFSECRGFLDNYATSSCQYAQNIHICTDILNVRLESREKQELDRLKCTEKVKACRQSNIARCLPRTFLKECSNLESMKNCLYEQGCKEHYNLLNIYYTNVCLQTNCNSTDVKSCDQLPADNTTKSVCSNLAVEYRCVLRRKTYSENVCKMPTDWQNSYKDKDCEHPCYNILKPDLKRFNPDKAKCNELNRYISNLNSTNCKMPADMETEYKSLKCDTICNEMIPCRIHIDYDRDRIQNCGSLSRGLECLKKAKCPIDQIYYDQYSYLECGSSCDATVSVTCEKNLKEPINSTRQEQCGFFRETRDCEETSRCITDNKEYEYLDCGAASLNTMFSFIISVLLTVQMLEKYISIS